MRALILVTALTCLPAVASATELNGTWERSNGHSRLHFEACGTFTCGNISWIKPGIQSPAHVGQKVFYDLSPANGTEWKGKAYNPEDGKTYTGGVTLQGDTLITKGCVLGGLICKSETWKRVS